MQVLFKGTINNVAVILLCGTNLNSNLNQTKFSNNLFLKKINANGYLVNKMNIFKLLYLTRNEFIHSLCVPQFNSRIYTI